MRLPPIPADNTFRVLVVEDDPSIGKLVSIHLQMAGFQSQLATNGLEGWTAFTQFDPHLVVSDISMPGLSGLDLTAKIRTRSGIPVILITAANTDENELKGFKSGADDYVAKPFNPKLLIARVVANLRRVYRYEVKADTPRAPLPVKPKAAAATPLPENWSRCDACGYMGPQEKFVGTGTDNMPIFVCPNCSNRTVTFSLG